MPTVLSTNGLHINMSGGSLPNAGTRIFLVGKAVPGTSTWTTIIKFTHNGTAGTGLSMRWYMGAGRQSGTIAENWWVAGIGMFVSTATTWTSATASTTSTSVTISGLTASTLYDYRVSTSCGTNGTSGFASAQFTTSVASVCGTAFEPNETTAAAAAITSGVVNSAAITTATDVDYFKITTTATSNITYSLVGPSGVDYDLTIYNSAGTQLSTSAGTTATETISLTSQAAGTYYIKVFGYSGAFSATCYTIQATATSTSCQNIKDTSTNNTTTGAAVIPFNTNITGLIDVGSDVDHYKFTITTGGTITLTLTTLPANYNLRLVNSAGTILNTSSNSGTTSESIAATVTAGTYYARVYPSTTSIFNATSCYTLKVALGTATKPVDYTFENNSTLSVFPNPAQQQLYVDLKSLAGVTDIKVYDVNGVQVLSQKSNLRQTQIDISKLPMGVYMIKAIDKENNISRTKFVKE